VRTYLIAKGIDPARVTAKGYGLSKPIASNKTVDGRAQNRRTEVTIL
jgi:OmpA-OmpF porin, OOP family